MNYLEIILGQIPEAIYFALFMIYAKNLKEKRVLFTVLMAIEYVLSMIALPYSTWSHILIFVITYILLKVLYKEKCQITDIFTLAIASIILMLCCLIPSFIFIKNMNNYFWYYTYVITTRILMFSFLFIFRYKLFKIQKLYKKLWNRNDKSNKKIKTTTFRSANLVIFNIMFYVINICMLYALYLRK